MSLITKVIGGGQSGADLAGWQAAIRAGIKTDGYMPKDCMTEYGPRPEYRDLYGAREHKSPDYVVRTKANIDLAATDRAGPGLVIIFDCQTPASKGTRAAVRAVEKHPRFPGHINHAVIRVDLMPAYYKVIGCIRSDKPYRVADHIRMNGMRVLMVAGNRESIAMPDFSKYVGRYLDELFHYTNGTPFERRTLSEQFDEPTTPDR